MSKVVVTDSDKLGVTLANVKEHLRITGTDEDQKLEAFIEAATTHLERYLGRYIKSTTIDYYLDSFPDEIELPYPAASSVTSVKYIDTDGAEQTVSASVYDTDLNAYKGLIYPAYNQQWPTDVRIHKNSVIVRFVCGFSTVPKDLQHGLFLLIGDMYENREDTSALTMKKIPNGVEALVNTYLVFR